MENCYGTVEGRILLEICHVCPVIAVLIIAIIIVRMMLKESPPVGHHHPCKDQDVPCPLVVEVVAILYHRPQMTFTTTVI